MYLNILNTKLYGGIYEVVRTSRPTGNTSRVTLLQQRINSTPLYHVGLYVEERGFSKIFEHGPIQYDRFRDLTASSCPSHTSNTPFGSWKTLSIPSPKSTSSASGTVVTMSSIYSRFCTTSKYI